MFSLSPKFQERLKNKKGRRSWWLFHATDFQTLMYPCFTICRILGIFPYKINGSSFETSKPCYLLSTIVTCIFSFCVLMMITDIPGWFNIPNVQKTIEINFVYLFGSFIMVVTYVLSGPRMRLLQTILKNSSRLPSKTYQKQSMVIHAKDIFGFFFLLVHVSMCIYTFEASIFIKIPSLYIALITYQTVDLYINCVWVLKTCFKKINDDLANLLVMNNELHLVRWINYKERNLQLLMELTLLKKQHLMVSDSVQRLNIIFSPQLLAIIATTFIQITMEIYFNIVQWQNGLSIKWTKEIHGICLIISIIWWSIKIAMIAWVSETGKNEATKINTAVHDVLNSISDEQVKHELQLFSLQIMHCDNTFSTKGLTLGATLVTTMMGTVTTYLLILIQFLMMSHSCDGKIAINVTQAT